jgi:hypothetical protein
MKRQMHKTADAQNGRRHKTANAQNNRGHKTADDKKPQKAQNGRFSGKYTVNLMEKNT